MLLLWVLLKIREQASVASHPIWVTTRGAYVIKKLQGRRAQRFVTSLSRKWSEETPNPVPRTKTEVFSSFIHKHQETTWRHKIRLGFPPISFWNWSLNVNLHSIPIHLHLSLNLNILLMRYKYLIICKGKSNKRILFLRLLYCRLRITGHPAYP